jgi:hypothetical protein
VGKLKAAWIKTDIPKDIKVKLWRIMKDNPTYESWQLYISNHPELFTKDEEQRVRMSRDTYKRLQDEVRAMPHSEVLSLPKDLQDWIVETRPDLKQELKRQRLEQSSKSHTISSITPIIIPKRKIKSHIIERKIVDGKVEETDRIELH